MKEEKKKKRRRGEGGGEGKGGGECGASPGQLTNHSALFWRKPEGDAHAEGRHLLETVQVICAAGGGSICLVTFGVTNCPCD